MKSLLSKGKTKLKSAYLKSVSPNPSTTNVSANNQKSEHHGQSPVALEQQLSRHENAAQGETLDAGNADSTGKSVALLEASDSSATPHPAVSAENSSEYPSPLTQAPSASVAPPSADATVSCESELLESSSVHSHGAYWYLAMKRLDEDERKALEELDLTFDGDTSGLGTATTDSTKLPATQQSKPGFSDENASKLALLISERINRLDDKAWRFRFRGRDIILRDLATKVVTWLNKFKEIGDIAIQIDPVHAALPWAAIRFLLQAVTIGQELAGHILIGSEKVSYLLARCQIYKKLYLSEPEDAEYESGVLLRKTLVDLYAAILSFLVYLMKLSTSSSIKGLLHATLNPTGLSERLSRLERLESKIETEANNCERETRALSDAAWNRKMEDMHNILSRHILLSKEEREKYFEACELEERCAILQWISDIQYEADLYNARVGRTEGTGQWLLDDAVYHDWRTTSASICLWLHGIPGAGKTKLSTKVVDDLLSHLSGQTSNEGLAFFFCDRNREKHKDPVWVLRTLLRQLAASLSDTTIVKCIRNKYIEAKGKGFASPITQEQCADLLLELANIFPQITFVLDGLDECDKDTRGLLIDTLDATMRKSGHPVKVFIASREHDDISLRYSSGDHLRVTAARNNKDIEKFVSDRMLSSRYCRTRMSDTVREQVLTTFRTKSQGMFQWAALHIQELLKLERDSDVLKYLDELPVGIKAAYDKIYQRIQSQRGGKSDIAIAAMKIMMCLCRPLTPGELAIAACQVPGQDFNEDVDIGPLYMLEACHDLVEVYHGGSFKPRYVPAEEAQLLHRVVKHSPLDKSHHNQEADEMADCETRDVVFCRFSHLSVTEYLLTQWDVTELNVFVCRLCFHTLFRFSIHAADEEHQGRLHPLEPPGFRCVPLRRAYHYIETFIKWRFANLELDVTSDIPTPRRITYYEFLLTEEERQRSVNHRDFMHVSGQAPVAWLQYCVRYWYRHLRTAMDSPSITADIKDSLNSLLYNLYGHPLNGSCFWRAWTMFCELFSYEPYGDCVLAGYQRFLPAFWCSGVGDADSLLKWIDGGLLDTNFASDGRKETMGLEMEPSKQDRRLGTFGDAYSLFRAALKNGNENLCIELLARGAGRSFNHRGESMVEFAVRSRKSSLVRRYVESGIDIKQNYYNGSLLHSAVQAGVLETVRLLAHSGADLDLRTSMFNIPWELTPLELACLLPIPDEIPSFLYGLVSGFISCHPLAVSFAALTNKIKFLSRVASSGTNIDARVPHMEFEKPLPFRVGETPLTSVIRCTRYRSSRLVMNISTRREAITTLLQYGADPNMVGVDGQTPLQMAIHTENHHFSIPLILYGADLTVRNEDGTTVLQLASSQGDVSLVRLLISRGTNVNEVSGVYRTALRAAFIGDARSIREFDAGSNSIGQDEDSLEYEEFSKQLDGEEGHTLSTEVEQSNEDDGEPVGGNTALDKWSDDSSDHVKPDAHSLADEGSIAGDSIDSISEEMYSESESTDFNAVWPFETIPLWPRRRLIPNSLPEQLKAGIKPSTLPEDDDPGAAFCILVEHGVIFDREHYSGVNSDEVDMMELLFIAYSELLKSRSSNQGLRGRFRRRPRYCWEDVERVFIARRDGYAMVKYLLNTEESIFPWEDEGSRE